MNLPNLLENDRLKAIFGSLTAERFPHAVLFEGQLGSGKKTIAKLTSVALVCQNDTVQPCMTCNGCKKALDNNHSDISFIDASDGKCTIERIREMKQDAFIRAGEAERKVYILNGADKLSPICQNALLKMLEEPPIGVYFFLLCENSSMLLQTIRSRTTKFVLEAVSCDTVEQFLRTKYPNQSLDNIQKSAELSGGICGLAESLLLNTGDDNSEMITNFCQALCSGSELSTFEGVKSLENLGTEEIQAFAQNMRIVLRNAIFYGAGINDMRPPLILKANEMLYEKFETQDLRDFSELFAQIETRCTFHAGVTATIGTLAAKIAKIKAKYI